ncbi:hypothetical protein [Vibrio owensii]|uniref:hypothetical protein n=1 Tax=Vibrio harveyi group TaxID=717610 RepID=UPI003CC5B907
MDHIYIISSVGILVVSSSFLIFSWAKKAQAKKKAELEKLLKAKLSGINSLEEHLAGTIKLGMTKVIQCIIMSRISNLLQDANTVIYSKHRHARINELRELIATTEASKELHIEKAVVKCSSADYPNAVRLIKSVRKIAQKEYVYGSFGQAYYSDAMRYLTEYEAKIFMSHYAAKIKAELAMNDTIKARSTMSRCVTVLRNYSCEASEQYIVKLDEMISKIDQKNKEKAEAKQKIEDEREKEMQIVFDGVRKKW